MITNLITLQSATPQDGFLAQYGNIFMIVILIGIFYFFMIRPQQKKQKETRLFREGLQQGDKVITAGGIYGKIRQIKDTSVLLEIAPNVTITIDKGMIYPSASDAQTDTANTAADKK